MQKTMVWLKSLAVRMLGMVLDSVEQSRLVSDIIQLRISMSVDTMARMYFCISIHVLLH